MKDRSVAVGAAVDSSQTGVVLANFGRSALLQTHLGALHCAIRGRQLRLVCGDCVNWSNSADGPTVIGVLPRSNVLERIDSRGRGEAVAANIARLAVVIAPQPEPEWFVVDRFLAGAQTKDISALLIINKSDLHLDSLRTHIEVYRRIGVSCHEVSANSPASLDELRKFIDRGATMLVGQSGVGKSSLINALLPDAAAQTAALSRDAEGRHTTTTARLYQLNPTTTLIDAPGVRDFAPPAALQRAAERGFVEVHAAGVGCRFNDCRHFDEPGCAVRAAVATGAVDARRYESYRRLARLFESFIEYR